MSDSIILSVTPLQARIILEAFADADILARKQAALAKANEHDTGVRLWTEQADLYRATAHKLRTEWILR